MTLFWLFKERFSFWESVTKNVSYQLSVFNY